MTPTPAPLSLVYSPFDAAQGHILIVFVIAVVLLSALGGAVAAALRGGAR